MIKKYFAGMLIGGFLSVAVSGEKEIILKMDYSGKQQCVYGIEYTSQGNFKQKGVMTKKNTEVNCLISATVADRNRLAIKVDTVFVKSDFIKGPKLITLRQSILKTNYVLTLVNGYPSIDTAAKIPVTDYLEWDLYRQLIKMLPAIPDKPVQPGFTWENTVTLPLRTARGAIPCELYRFYTFKKLQGDTATISWNFRYAPAENAVDSTNALEEIPVGGNGSGMALIDVRNKCLLGADMGFSTPVAVINDISVTWRERAVFTLKQSK